MTDRELSAADARLTGLTAEQRVQWAAERFGKRLAAASSFGADSAVILHLVASVTPETPVITVDTGFLFAETVAFREELARRFKLEVHVYRPRMSPQQFVDEHGAMWRTNPDACCAFNKREPFERAKRELDLAAWITGVRREQSHSRRETPFIGRDFHGFIRLCPLADWTAADVHYHLLEHDLPYHPLRADGYMSIGCQPEQGYCTRRVAPGDDPRAGRWAGFDKTECGLHTYDSGAGI
jgi:phosphoadenosine phosphosulfate reductase